MDVVCGIRLAEQLLKVGVVALDARCLDLKSVEDVKGNGVAMLGGIYCFEEHIANTYTLFVGQQYVKILER